VTVASISLDELTADPHDALRRIREAGPIVWVPALDGWVVAGRSVAVSALRDADLFTVDDPRFSTRQVVGESMLSTDGATHRHHRAPFGETYTKRAVDRDLADWTQRTAAALVAEIQPAGKAELRESLAAPFAVTCILHTLGLDHVDPAMVIGWYRDIVATVESISAEHATQPVTCASYSQLASVITAASGIDAAATFRASTQSLTANEVVSNTAVIMFGAIETTEGAISNALLHLLSSPADLAAIRANKALIANAVEESMRLEPAAASVDRYVTRDAEVAGVRLAKGDYVMISLAGANRDPLIFDKPDRFDIHRDNLSLSTTFAYGPHACLGIHLARLEVTAMVEALVGRLGQLRLEPSKCVGPRGLIFRKPVAVTATWEDS